MIVIKCDKCGKEFEVGMASCEDAYISTGGQGFEQVVRLIIPFDVMRSLKRKGSGETLCTDCTEEKGKNDG